MTTLEKRDVRIAVLEAELSALNHKFSNVEEKRLEEQAESESIIEQMRKESVLWQNTIEELNQQLTDRENEDRNSPSSSHAARLNALFEV